MLPDAHTFMFDTLVSFQTAPKSLLGSGRYVCWSPSASASQTENGFARLGPRHRVIGHDIDVKQTYESLVQPDERPDIFLDVGANYGTHSILFLSAGIPVAAFEPNPNCAQRFQVMCALNNLAGRWEPVALGEAAGEVELVFPKDQTWLGTVSGDIASELKESGNTTSLRVPVVRWFPMSRKCRAANSFSKLT